MTRVKKAEIAFLMLLVFSPVLAADSLSLSFVQNATDNLYQSSLSEGDQASTLSFSLDKSFSRFSLYASGKYSYLYENSQITAYSQDLGLDYLFALGEKSAVYLSILGSGTFYRSDYKDFNYVAFNAFSAIKSYLSQTSILKSNYSFVYRKYRASLFDYWSHSALVSLDKYFQTRTTVKAELDWEYKHFIHPFQELDYSFETDMPRFAKGKGKGKPDGQKPNTLSNTVPDGGHGIQIFSVSAILAQGIGSKVGLNISGTKQWVLSGQNPFTSVQEFYMVENPSYDRFSWQGYQVGSQLAWLAPWMLEVKIGYSYSGKLFPGIGSLSAGGDPLGVIREDSRRQIEAGIEKNFARISFFVSYAYIANRSNDPYFDWNGHFFSVGFSWNHSLGRRP